VPTVLRRCTLATLAAVITSVVAQGRASADPSGTEADRLFEDARAAMARGDYASACPALERSEALDPGIGTEFNLARCYELAGRLASAYRAYEAVQTATHAAGQTDREGVARALAAALEPRIAHVMVHLPEGAPPPGFELRCDGVAIDKGPWDTALPVDPGEHTLEAAAPSTTPFKATFVVEREAQLVSVDVPLFATRPLLTPAPALSSPLRERATQAGTSFGARRGLALALAGLAIAGAGVGTYYGVKALSRASQASPFCDASGCDPTGFSLRGEARWAGDASTVSFTIGGVLAVAAAILWFTEPSSARRTAWNGESR
jgi:hypothetical protein